MLVAKLMKIIMILLFRPLSTIVTLKIIYNKTHFLLVVVNSGNLFLVLLMAWFSAVLGFNSKDVFPSFENLTK